MMTLDFPTREAAERLRSPKIIILGKDRWMTVAEIRHRPAPYYGAAEQWTAVLRPLNLRERVCYRLKIWMRLIKPVVRLRHIYRFCEDGCNYERLRFDTTASGFNVVSEAAGTGTRRPESDQTVIFQ